MKRILVITLALILSACGPQATPTIDPAQVQASAIAAANTMVALTQAAVPTDTPTLPPSPTPLPSPTPFPLPTLDTSSFPTAALPTVPPSSGGDDCVHPLDMSQAGPTHRTLVRNQTGGTINISLNLYKKNDFGQCGSISYGGMGKGSSVLAELPAGNWFAYAWADVKGKSFTVSGSFFVQPAQFDRLELCVRTETIVYTPSC